MTSYQQSPSRALDYPMSSGVPISGVAWDGVPDDDFGLYPVEVEQVSHRHLAPVAVCDLQPLWRGLRNGLLIELAVILAIVAWVLA
jgi:hypothetical protein